MNVAQAKAVHLAHLLLKIAILIFSGCQDHKVILNQPSAVGESLFELTFTNAASSELRTYGIIEHHLALRGTKIYPFYAKQITLLPNNCQMYYGMDEIVIGDKQNAHRFAYELSEQDRFVGFIPKQGVAVLMRSTHDRFTDENLILLQFDPQAEIFKEVAVDCQQQPGDWSRGVECKLLNDRGVLCVVTTDGTPMAWQISNLQATRLNNQEIRSVFRDVSNVVPSVAISPNLSNIASCRTNYNQGAHNFFEIAVWSCDDGLLRQHFEKLICDSVVQIEFLDDAHLIAFDRDQYQIFDLATGDHTAYRRKTHGNCNYVMRLSDCDFLLSNILSKGESNIALETVLKND